MSGAGATVINQPAIRQESKHPPLAVIQRPNFVLLGGLLAFLLGLPGLVAPWLGWMRIVLLIPASIGWLICPLYLYIAIRRATEIGWNARLLAATILSALGLILWVLGICMALVRMEHGLTP
jgi:hypothetical protein